MVAACPLLVGEKALDVLLPPGAATPIFFDGDIGLVGLQAPVPDLPRGRAARPGKATE